MKTKTPIILLAVIALVGGFLYGYGFFDQVKSNKIADRPVPTIPSAKETQEARPTEVVEEVEEATESAVPSIDPGLVAYYPFDKDTKDYSGNENDGTNHNAFFVEGKNDKALKFNGRNSYINAPVNINPDILSQMTMTAWVKENDGAKIMHVVSSDDAGYDRAMGTDNRGPGQEGWACFAGDGQVLGSHPITADKWTFIATVYDQDIGTVKLFVDGSVYEKEAKIAKGNDFILIGARGTTKQQGEYFKGVIDEVRIYDQALSDKELNSLWKTGTILP